MEEQIKKALKGVEDISQRKLLEEILNEVFLNLYSYSKEEFDKIQNQVWEELTREPFSMAIYTTMAKKSSYDPTDSFFYPMDPNDLKERTWDLRKLRDALRKKEEFYLFSVCFYCDTLLIQKILSKEAVWKGCLVTERGSYEICFELRKKNTYQKKVEELYSYFLENGIPWEPVFAPYIQKMADVYVIYCEQDLKKDQEIKEIHLDFGIYENFVKKEMIPLWNLCEITEKTRGFANPVDGVRLYEHKISFMDGSGLDGYLLCGAKKVNISQKEPVIAWDKIRRGKDFLSVYCDTDESMAWKLLKIGNGDRREKTSYLECMTNQKRPGVIHSYADRSAFAIPTKGEMNRLLYAFPSLDSLEIEACYLTKGEKSEGYCMEPFYQKKYKNWEREHLMIWLKENDPGPFSCDRLSFFLAQVSRRLPEYPCSGRLIYEDGFFEI